MFFTFFVFLHSDSDVMGNYIFVIKIFFAITIVLFVAFLKIVCFKGSFGLSIRLTIVNYLQDFVLYFVFLSIYTYRMVKHIITVLILFFFSLIYGYGIL